METQISASKERERSIFDGTLSDDDALAELRRSYVSLFVNDEMTSQQRREAAAILKNAVESEAPAAIEAQVPLAKVLWVAMQAVGKVIVESQQSISAKVNLLNNHTPAMAKDGRKASMGGMAATSAFGENDNVPAASSPRSRVTDFPSSKRNLDMFTSPALLGKRAHEDDDAQDMHRSKRNTAESKSDRQTRKAQPELSIPSPTSQTSTRGPPASSPTETDPNPELPEGKHWFYEPIDSTDEENKKRPEALIIDSSGGRGRRRSTRAKTMAVEAKLKKQLIVELRVRVSEDDLRKGTIEGQRKQAAHYEVSDKPAIPTKQLSTQQKQANKDAKALEFEPKKIVAAAEKQANGERPTGKYLESDVLSEQVFPTESRFTYKKRDEQQKEDGPVHRNSTPRSLNVNNDTAAAPRPWVRPSLQRPSILPSQWQSVQNQRKEQHKRDRSIVRNDTPGSLSVDTDAAARRSLVVRLPVKWPSSLSANVRTDDERSNRSSISSTNSSTVPSPPTTYCLPPFPPLKPRELAPFYKGASIAVENIDEDHEEQPTRTLLELIHTLEMERPDVPGAEGQTILKGGRYVYEALKELYKENGDISIEDVCEQFEAHLEYEHECMQDDFQKGGRA